MACGRGETGRRSGLKIRFPEMGVRVRFPPSAPLGLRFAALAVLVLAAPACSDRDDANPVTLSVISDRLKLADPLVMPTNASDEVLLAATAQGLVAFDAEGRITPALAERWIVTDDGLSLIMRIRRARWTDGKVVTGREVAERLRAIMAPGSRHPFRPLFGGVSNVIAMTGQVVEIRMRTPQPELLQLLAQPEMAIIRGSASQGSGPYRVHSVRAGVTRLRPIPDEMAENVEDRGDRDDMRVRAEPVALAVARFQAREIGMVTGGSFADLALARAARPAAAQFQVDPVYGLFGLAVSSNSQALSEAAVRKALAMVIDRERIVRSFGVSSWQAQYAVLPAQLDSAAPPAALEWIRLPQPERQARARELIGNVSRLPVLRVAMPAGPGSRLLFAEIAADWRKIGVRAQAVALNAPADLQLIDEVAPQSAAFWYLIRLSCARGLPCDPATEAALSAVQTAQTVTERTDSLAEADARLAERQAFIPIALPLRWSLVSPNLKGFRTNAFALHSLQRLRAN